MKKRLVFIFGNLPNVIQVILLLVCIFVLSWLCINNYGYLGVLLSPELVKMETEPRIVAGDYLMNGQTQRIFKENISVFFSEPKILLMGAHSFVTNIDTPNGKLIIKVPMNQISHISNEENNIFNNASIDFYIPLSSIGNNLYCSSNQKITIDPRSNVHIGSYNRKSGYKYEAFETKITINEIIIKVELNCVDENKNTIRPVEEMVINNLNIYANIDSKLIYEWSNKGGDTYKL